MSIIFFDGFDYVAGVGGAGGRKWNQSGSGGVAGGRFGGQCMQTGGNGGSGGAGANVTFTTAGGAGTIIDCSTIIVGFAILVTGYVGAFGSPEFPSFPLVRFRDLATVQCSLWINPSTQFLEIRTSDGTGLSPTIVLTTNYIPPLGLWFYLECKVTCGNPGSVELMVDGSSIGSASGLLQVSANPYCNTIEFNSYNNYSGGVQAGSWFCDDLYVINDDSVNNTTYLGEVRVQTKYPDADGFEDDFLRSTGLVNADNVDETICNYSNTSAFNYSGTVGAKDLYSIGNFTVSGTIFAVQENMAFKKDDVGNRTVCPILRTAATNYMGPYLESAITGGEVTTLSFSCYSSYTYGGEIWELNPNTVLPWQLIDLNLTEFGIKVTS